MNPEPMPKKVAFIHDWLNGMRGGEKVLECMLDLFPDAHIFTLFLERQRISERINAHPIQASYLNRFRFARKRYRFFLPFFPAAIEDFDLQAYDLVISSSHCVAKGIIPAPDSLHVCYTHSPMRYIWDQYFAYFESLKGLKRRLVRRQTSRLRQWDVCSSARVDRFIANSEFVRSRIKRYYRREATVIHPPIDTDFFQPADDPGRDFFLSVSALVPYKRMDVVIQAFTRMNERLIVVGGGPEESSLRRMAGESVEFRKDIGDDELRRLYQNARALVFAGVEDFGMSFVEAQACGTPVIAHNRGGVRDIVESGRHGILFDRVSPEAVIETVELFKARAGDHDGGFAATALRENSLRFSRASFRERFTGFINEAR